jgi:hypothetical protein
MVNTMFSSVPFVPAEQVNLFHRAPTTNKILMTNLNTIFRNLTLVEDSKNPRYRPPFVNLKRGL